MLFPNNITPNPDATILRLIINRYLFIVIFLNLRFRINKPPTNIAIEPNNQGKELIIETPSPPKALLDNTYTGNHVIKKYSK